MCSHRVTQFPSHRYTETQRPDNNNFGWREKEEGLSGLTLGDCELEK